MDAEFSNFESFLVDDGQLEGMTPQQCFVLGYELHSVASLAESRDDKINKTVHAANIERIEAFLRARGRDWNWMWPSDDVSESWVYLTILARDG